MIAKEPSADEMGQLFIYVKESRNVPVRGAGAFCIIQHDKQQVKTHGAKIVTTETGRAYEPWEEGFTFDVTNVNNYNTDMKISDFFISLYSTNEPITAKQPVDNTDGQFIGQISIPVVAVMHQNPVDQWFKISSKKANEDIPGEIRLKLQYTSMSKKITVNDFEPLKVVGRGSFAKVMLVKKNDTGRLYAMKVMRKQSVIKNNAVKHTMSEKNVLTRMNHPFIVSLKYSFQTEDKLYMILDYISGGELFYHLSEAEIFSEPRAKFYTAEIVCALGYLHNHSIVYRDLKPENVLLDLNGHIVLTDFGLCKEGLGFGNLTHTFCGSPEYLAPEIFIGTGYDKSVDWWALGTLLYEMLTGLPPFFSENVQEMNQKILSEPLTFPDYFSEDAKSILTKLLDRNPKKRLGYGPNDAEDVKKHPFFKGVDWIKLENKQIEPPFRPYLKNELDVRFFDPDTTSEVPRHSIINSNELTSKEQDLFEGFSWSAPSVLMRRRTSSGSKGRRPGSLSLSSPRGNSPIGLVEEITGQARRQSGADNFQFIFEENMEDAQAKPN